MFEQVTHQRMMERR